MDGTVCGGEFAARWFFLADRALPAEGRMNAKRLLRRREGQRQLLLTAGDYVALNQDSRANLLRKIAYLATRAPDLGEHTDDVLTTLLGYDPARLSDLRAKAII